MTEVSFIKNDISKIINKLNNIVSETESLKSEIQNKFISFETLQDNHNIVIKNIQSNLELNSTNNDKITQLITFKNNVDKDIMDVNQKIYILNDGLNNSCAKFDKIIGDNLVIPDLVGEKCKFKDLKDFIEV